MEKLFFALLNRSIAAGFMVLAVLFLRLLFRKGPRWVFCLLWGLVALRLLCPVSIQSPLSLAPETPSLEERFSQSAGEEVTPGTLLTEDISPDLTAAAPEPSHSPDWGILLSRVWALGFGLMLLYALGSLLALRQRLADATLLGKGIKGSQWVSSPFVMGLFRPTIYLPYHLDEDCQKYVLAHENAHIRRRDHWLKPLAFLLLSVYWFQPLLWLAYILFCRDMETACDEKAVKDMEKEERRAYSRALLQCSLGRHSFTGPLAFGEVGVKERVRRVMNYKKPQFWLILLALAAGLITGVCLLTDRPEPKTPTEAGEISTVYIGDAPKTVAVAQSLSYPEGLSYASVQLQTTKEPYGLTVYLKGQGQGSQEAFRSCAMQAFDRIGNLGVIAFWSKSPEQELARFTRQEMEEGEPLADAVSQAIVEQNSPGETGDSLVRCGSFVELGRDTFLVDSDPPQDGGLVLYGIAMYQAFARSGQGLESQEGSHIPAILTFQEGKEGYVLTDYWTPRDGSFYLSDIQEHFPKNLAQSALNTQDYVLMQMQDCYAQAISRGGVNPARLIPALLEKVESSPAASSAPGDYIAAHPDEWNQLLYLGDSTLDYVFGAFLKGGQTGLHGQLLRQLLDDLAPESAIKTAAETGQDYFDAWKAHHESILKQNGEEWMQQHHPAFWKMKQLAAA